MTAGAGPVHLAASESQRLPSPRTPLPPMHPAPVPPPPATMDETALPALHPNNIDEAAAAVVAPSPPPPPAPVKPHAFPHAPVRAPWRATLANPLPQPHALPQPQATRVGPAEPPQRQHHLPPVAQRQTVQRQVSEQMQQHVLIHRQMPDQAHTRTSEGIAVERMQAAGAVRGGKGARKAKDLGVMSAGTLDGRPSFTCAHCAERFRSRMERKQHIRTLHTKPFQCVECKSCFSRKFDLEKHRLTVHRKERPYGCELCELSFGQKHHLVRHQKAVHTKARDFGCPECGADFARKEHLANHVRSVHEKARPFLCFLCDAEYCEKRGLRRHLESLHVVKQTRAAVFASWQPEGKESIPPITEILKL